MKLSLWLLMVLTCAGCGVASSQASSLSANGVRLEGVYWIRQDSSGNRTFQWRVYNTGDRPAILYKEYGMNWTMDHGAAAFMVHQNDYDLRLLDPIARSRTGDPRLFGTRALGDESRFGIASGQPFTDLSGFQAKVDLKMYMGPHCEPKTLEVILKPSSRSSATKPVF
jgi:hypothetical protein